MDCRDLKQHLQPFLEDLLREKDYQEACLHLSCCSQCTEHLASIDSLSHAVKTLGELDAPADLAQTVLFHLKETAAREPEAKTTRANQSPAKSRRMATAVAALGVAGTLALLIYLNVRSSADKSPQPPVIVTAHLQRPGSDQMKQRQEAAALAELQAMAAALGVSQTESSQSRASRAANGGQRQTDEDEAESKQTPVAGLKPLHWHVLLAAPSQRARLLNVLDILGVERDYETPELFILTISGWQLKRLTHEIQAIVSADALPISMDEAAWPGKEAQTRLSVYLGESSLSLISHFHGHMGANARDVLNAAGGLGVAVDYQSGEMLVLSVPRIELAAFMKRMRALSADDTNDFFPDTSIRQFEQRGPGAVRVSIYLTE